MKFNFFLRNLKSICTSAAVISAALFYSPSSLASSAASAQASSQPSWFPKVSCRDAWKKRDLSKYDHQVDSKLDPTIGNVGYQSYKARLSKSGVIRENCYKDWTVLVYMSADNDLSPYALWDLFEMEGPFASGSLAASTLKSDLIVQADTEGRTGIRRLHMFQAPGEKYEAPRGKEQFEDSNLTKVLSPVVQYFPESVSATSADHKKRMAEFLDWGMRAYPAEKYFVIVWGHGQGWAAEPTAPAEAKSRFVEEGELPISFGDWPEPAPLKGKSDFNGRFGGFAFSETPGDYLSVPALSKILSQTVQTTLEGKRPIDVYAADACLMQMAEVANEIADSARFIVGSAQVQTFLGLPYRQLMYEINSGGFRSANQLVGKQDEAYLIAKMLPKLAEGALDPQRGQQGRADKKAARTFTMSALSSSELKMQLIPALDKLGRSLVSYITEDPMRAMDIDFLIKQTPSFMGGARELGSFAGLLQIQLKEEAAAKGQVTPAARKLSLAIDHVKDAARMTAIAHGFGTDYKSASQQLHLLGFNSIGVWIPQTPKEYSERIEDFKQSKLYSQTKGSWEAWIKAIHAP